MIDAPRITVDELKTRMEAGEDFELLDVRRPDVWEQSDTMLPEAIRVSLDKLDESLARIPKDKPSSHTAHDRTKDLAPVWCSNFKSWDIRMPGRFAEASKHGKTPDCLSIQNGKLRNE